MDLTPRDLTRLMLETSQALDVAQANLVDASAEWARAENEYKKARSAAYLSTEGTVAEREAKTDRVVERERYEAHLKEGLKVAALENVRSKRAQLSALQSIAAAVKAEAELTRYGP